MIILTDSGKNYPWILKPSIQFDENRVSTQSLSNTMPGSLLMKRKKIFMFINIKKYINI